MSPPLIPQADYQMLLLARLSEQNLKAVGPASCLKLECAPVEINELAVSLAVESYYSQIESVIESEILLQIFFNFIHLTCLLFFEYYIAYSRNSLCENYLAYRSTYRQPYQYLI